MSAEYFPPFIVLYAKAKKQDGKTYLSVDGILERELGLKGCQVVYFTKMLYDAMSAALFTRTAQEPFVHHQYAHVSVEMWNRIQNVRRFFGKRVAAMFQFQDLKGLRAALEPIFEKGTKCAHTIDDIVQWSDQHEHYLNGHLAEVVNFIDICTVDAIHRVYIKLWPKVIYEHRETQILDRKGMIRILRLTDDYKEPKNLETSGIFFDMAWNMQEFGGQ